MKLDNKYYWEYTPKDIKSAHALIRRLREKLRKTEMRVMNLVSMLPAGYTYKQYKTK